MYSQPKALSSNAQGVDPSFCPSGTGFLVGVSACGLVALVCLTGLLQMGSSDTVNLHVAGSQAITQAASLTRQMPRLGNAAALNMESKKPISWQQPSMQSSSLLHASKQGYAMSGSTAQVVASMGAFLGGLALTTWWKASTKRVDTSLCADSNSLSGAATPKYTLRYFDARGVAEVIRLLFSVSGVPYEDYRYKFSFGVPGDFSTISMPEFKEDKASGVLDPNMGRLPILEVNGVPIGQSKAIERYLSKKFGYLGDNEVEEAQIDAICEHVRDIKDAYRRITGIRDAEEKAEAMTKWYAADLPSWCQRLEKCLGPNGWAVGSKFSLADLSIWALLADSFNNNEAAAAAYRDCPRLQVICGKVAALEGVKTWLEKRPVTIM